VETTGTGRKVVIVAIVALVIVLALDAVLYFMLPPLDTVRPPTNTPGPSPTPLPTNTPVPTPTEIPCEPQVWWDSSRETIEAFFTTAMLQGSNEITAETFDQALSDQRALHDATSALAYPPCLDGARDNLLDAQNALLNAFSAPEAVLLVTGNDATANYQNARQFYTAIVDAYDNLASFVSDLEEQGVTLNNSDLGDSVRAVRAYTDINTLECMSTRWVMSEVLPWLILTANYQQAVTANPIDRDTLRRLVFTLQSEGTRIAGVPYPDCVEDARADLLEANDALVAVIQGILAGDTASSGDNMPTYSQALDRLQREISSSIDFLN